MFKRRENKKRLKEINEEANKMIHREFDEDKRVLIQMKVLDDENFLSPYSSLDEEIISEDVASFLEHRITPIDLVYDLHIQIASNCISEEDKIRYPKAIKNYYKDKVIKSTRRKKLNTFQSLWMIVMGLFILTIYLVLQFIYNNPLLEVIDIAAWVFVWEAVNLFFIERKTLKYEQIKDCKIFDAKVSFIEEGKNEK